MPSSHAYVRDQGQMFYVREQGEMSSALPGISANPPNRWLSQGLPPPRTPQGAPHLLPSLNSTWSTAIGDNSGFFSSSRGSFSARPAGRNEDIPGLARSDSWDLLKWKEEIAADSARILKDRRARFGTSKGLAKPFGPYHKPPSNRSSRHRRLAQTHTQMAVAAEKKQEVTINMHLDPFGISRNNAVETGHQNRKVEQMKRAREQRLKEKAISKQCRSEAQEWRNMNKPTKTSNVNVREEEEPEVEELEEIDKSTRFKEQPESQERDTRVSRFFDKMSRKTQIDTLSKIGEDDIEDTGGVQFDQDDGTAEQSKASLIANPFLSIAQRIKPPGTLDERINALVKRQKLAKWKKRNTKRYEARKSRFSALPASEQTAMRLAFQYYDADGSETLNIVELNSCLAELGLRGKNSEERAVVVQICQKLSSTLQAEELTSPDANPDEDSKEQMEFEVDIYQLVVDLLPQIRQGLQDQRRSALLLLFTQHDAKSSGKLGVDECKNIARGMDLATSVIMQVCEELIPKRTEKIDFEVFQKLIGRLHEITDRNLRRNERQIKDSAKLCESTFKKFRRELIPLWNNFQEWDADQSGMMDPEECCALMKEFGLLPRNQAEKEELEELIRNADADGEGGLDFREFLDLILLVRRKCMDKNKEHEKALFDKYDKDKSGQLSVAEVSAVLADLNLTPKTHEEQHEIRILIQDVDEDGSGELSFQEFQMLSQRVVERLMMLNLEAGKNLALELGFSINELKELRSVFDQLDTDGSNAIDIGEARQALNLLNRKIAEEQFRQVWQKIDVDGSDELDFSEFLRLMSILNDKDSVLSAAKLRVETLTYVETHTLQQILEIFKLGKDYVHSMQFDDLVQTCADCLGVGKNDSLQQVLGVNTVEELLAVSRRRASMNIF